MAELEPADVESFTNGRLSAADDEVQKMLDAALARARRHCGWSVSPVVTNFTAVLDGPGSRILSLPTRKIVELTSIDEDGTDRPLDTLRWSAGGPPGIQESPVRVRKRSGAFWSDEYQTITVVMDHGYTEEEAADWRYAVLSMVNQMGLTLVSGQGEMDVVSKKVDDVTYRWIDPYSAAADTALYSVGNILCGYELPRLEFL